MHFPLFTTFYLPPIFWFAHPIFLTSVYASVHGWSHELSIEPKLPLAYSLCRNFFSVEPRLIQKVCVVSEGLSLHASAAALYDIPVYHIPYRIHTYTIPYHIPYRIPYMYMPFVI